MRLLLTVFIAILINFVSFNAKAEHPHSEHPTQTKSFYEDLKKDTDAAEEESEELMDDAEKEMKSKEKSLFEHPHSEHPH